MFSSQTSGAVNAAVNGAVTTVTDAATGAVNAVSNATNSLFQSANTAVNNASKSMNSLFPLGDSSPPPPPPASNTNSKNSYPFFNFNNSNNGRNNGSNNGRNNGSNNGLNSVSTWFNPLYVFAGIVVVFLILFAVFNSQIKSGYEYIAGSIKNALGMPVHPDVTAAVIPVTVAPEAPQDVTPHEQALPQPSQKSIVERVLPSSGEVFNVAQNKFTYYDAEPLCKALGAELATYEQVKEAWGAGADWCNYGWVKGQMAIYPTQKGTYDKLQAGPADERGACGTVGINGGYFDNPEFKYGVNCYGNKPSQSAHDQEQLMAEGKVPKSPEALKVDALVAEFRDEADSLFVKPFSDQKWASN